MATSVLAGPTAHTARAAPGAGVGPQRAATAPVLVQPRDGEASFGEVQVRAPAGTRDVVLLVGGRWAGRQRVVEGEARFAVRATAARTGRTTVAVRLLDGARRIGVATSRDVWLLPRSGMAARAAAVRDAALSARLGELGRAFPGWAGAYVLDLRTGRWAGWNADASFLAASTVKLGVMIEALRRYGPFPERSAAWGDIAAMVSRSSNDAANRLFLRLGDGSESAGAALLEARFRAIGATSTTFPGTYRGLSARGAATRPAAAARPAALDAPAPPPILTWRRTTPRDLGRIVRAVHAAALGDRDALRRTGLSEHEARLGLALMLDASPEGGPFIGAFRAGAPVAQKTGWTDKARHSAAIVYAPDGPKVVVAMTYRPGIDAAAAGRFARGVAAAAGVGR